MKLALLLLLAIAHAQDQAARDLTVRLFDTDRVTALTITPTSPNTTWKPCPTCPTKPLTAPVTLSLKDHPNITATGNLRIETDTHRQANASALWHLDTDHDTLRLRVTLPSERYVAAVLTAEAAPSEPPASLRALAIAVRSYALTRKADLTDSTSTQTLRLGPISPAIAAAVRDTAGETLWFHTQQVPAFFTQSSGGTTESSSAAWSGPPQPWLPTQPDPASDRAPSQWHTEISLTDLRTALAREGFPLKSPIRSITVARRTPSGRAARILLTTESAPLGIPANTFRFAIGRALGWNRLRSDLYTVHLAGQTALFEGRGYGHGVGLSQSGARTLALEGRDTNLILHTYFPGAEVRITPTDTGWQTHEATGWTLITTALSPSLLKTGDLAWQKALTLIHPATPVHPEVRLYPTVPLFRSVTGEPGWTLAATRGDRIALQPAALKNPGNLLLHEFLHVLVEHESTANLPLWFREGLVEALAENPIAALPKNIADTEAHLAHPSTLLEAQKAHQEAAALVRRLVLTYSLPTILTWLHRGLPPDALSRASLR
jgi:stage II sporulation protein D